MKYLVIIPLVVIISAMVLAWNGQTRPAIITGVAGIVIALLVLLGIALETKHYAAKEVQEYD